ncbi:MAG: 3-deoxy-manno-octulosonate cytidylyltransferase [Candidatus Lokiarchaeota archaeon]|nr:3-deoxy-manno-octulosonate cytidylyltransferase [Candidatus Lokiarchaeota archaeon]
MNFIGIIPARYESSRFPGKPLCDILGKPMVARVYESVMEWRKWKQVFVATDSELIEDKCKEFSIPTIMTSTEHVDCIDRAAEAASLLHNSSINGDRYIIIQGDEPLFKVGTLDVDLSPTVVNFYTQVRDPSEIYDANAVKVVVSEKKKAIYFSRYTIPYHDEKTKRSDDELIVYKQIGVYSFSYDKLQLYWSLKPSYLEKIEGIGLLRLLENDVDIFMRYTSYDSISVDIPDDRQRIINLIKDSREKLGYSIDNNERVVKHGDRKP